MAAVAVCWASVESAQADGFAVSLEFRAVTASGSPSNPQCLIHMTDEAEGLDTNHITMDVFGDPTAVRKPLVHRASQGNFSDTIKNYDSVPNPTNSSVANELGGRWAWVIKIHTNAAANVSDYYFASWSSDHENTMGYSGNLGTNTANGARLTYSPLLRGKFVGETSTNRYVNGESLSNPFKDLTTSIRVGWPFASISQLNDNLAYYKKVMAITNYFAIYSTSGWGVTNWVCSTSVLMPSKLDGNLSTILQGQRRLGITYRMLSSPTLTDSVWAEVATGLIDGGVYANTMTDTTFFRAQQEGDTATMFSQAVSQPGIKGYVPQPVGWNNDEVGILPPK